MDNAHGGAFFSTLLGSVQTRIGRLNSSTPARNPISGFNNDTGTNTRPFYGLSSVFTIATPPPPPETETETDGPAAPANLQATVDGTIVTLSWSNPQDSSITHYSYQLQQEGQAREPWKKLADSNADTTSATIDLGNAAAESAQWTIRLRAWSGGAPGAISTVRSDSVVPAPAVPAVWLGVGAVLLVLARNRSRRKSMRKV